MIHQIKETTIIIIIINPKICVHADKVKYTKLLKTSKTLAKASC